jgi:predicted NBD/HSP70 family sugar kinase
MDSRQFQNGRELVATERRVLEEVWLSGPIARSVIAIRTGLGDATVTRLTRDLEARGLIADTVLRTGARGQPLRPLSLCADGAYALGVNFSRTYIDVGLVNLRGEIVSHERQRLARADVVEITEAARHGLTRAITATGAPLDRVVGAGFSVPGDFGETPNGFLAHALYPELRGLDLQAEFSARMPIPVRVENDAASAAMGERINGLCRNIASFLVVHIGHGVGGGMVLQGRLYRGAHGNAGILGLLYPDHEPRPSGQDLLETLAAAGVPCGDFDDLEDLSLEECAPLRRWMLRAAEQLRSRLPIASRIVDPQAIILGGRLPPHLLSAMVHLIDNEAMFRPTRHLPWPRLHASNLGPLAGVIGAASLCLHDAFFPQDQPRDLVLS